MMSLRPILIGALYASTALAVRGVDQAILALERSNSRLLQYPTQYTQGIVPKAIHSHNDYWRDVPLLTALSYGVSSVEADVYLVNGTLYVGHEAAALTEDRTFAKLYINPLRQILDGQNPKTAFNMNQTTPHGAFDTSSSTPVQLLVDIKTDGVEALPYILQALAPLREAGYLTTYTTNGTLVPSAVTVVGTGNSPLAQVKALSPRDYFFDAQLTQLNNATLDTIWDTTLSPIASTSFGAAIGWSGIGEMSAGQRANMTQLINDAHSRGIKARFWDTPGWPVYARENIWRELQVAGADWLNADDLKAASEF